MSELKKHPLQDLLLQAFADEGKAKYQDRVKLIRAIAGSDMVTGFAVLEGARIMAMDAYKVVADDVLGVMKEKGLVVRDRDGWYTLTDSGRAERNGLLARSPFAAQPADDQPGSSPQT